MIDKQADRSIYLQIADIIKNDIQSGRLKPHDPVMSENKISQKYEVTRLTARRSIDSLVNEGLLYRIRGKGTFVSEPEVKLEASPFSLRGFTESTLGMDRNPKNTVITFKIIEANKFIAEKLNISAGSKIFFVERLRMIDEDPLIFEVSYFPETLFPGLDESSMEGSAYEYVEKFLGKKIKDSTQEIVPDTVSERIGKFLQMNVGTPILRVHNQPRLEDGTIFEYSEAFFRTSKYKFIQHVTKD
jgi:GntR family mannosyl-D-glycerate transport/metabolism transcriptional repressor